MILLWIPPKSEPETRMWVQLVYLGGDSGKQELEQADWNNKKEKPIWGWTDDWPLQAWVCKTHPESSHDCPPQGQEGRAFTHRLSFPLLIPGALVLPAYRHCCPWAEQAPAAAGTASRGTVSSHLVYARDLGNQPLWMQWNQRCDEGYQGCLPNPIPKL